jgi:ankyrin repeat protein/nucleoside phosphorylase
LPIAQYGTINAAIVLTELKRTFPSVRLGLMVGIGGGVPSRADIRLGDIVVGTRVMQPDLGKIVGDGQFLRTAIPRSLDQFLGKVLTAFRTEHDLKPSRVPLILQEKLEGHPDYRRPNAPDRLFDATYNHQTTIPNCDHCDPARLVYRSPRKSDDVEIHYGAVASGNYVMKSGTMRDDIARELDVICFEMESAGMMDILPCLPIRGICDYSDTHKSKEWQKYAAATAAAYARELLEMLPVDQVRVNANRTSDHHEQAPIAMAPSPYADRSSSHDNQQRLLDSLHFEQIDARKMTIERAHNKTCSWFLKHPDYQAWLDPGKLAEHHGFLWISGKPGAGKSTIMKFAYLKTRKSHKNTVIASFFFNARGEYLERSVSGMYRSLLRQLLLGYPDLQKVLEDPEIVPQNQNGCPPLNILKDIFQEAVSGLGQRPFTCFIDALDECDEQQIMDMVQYFKGLGEDANNDGIPLRICFSSRHYPYINIRRARRLILEHQPGHVEDLTNYITSNLETQDPELLEKLLEKANGVFLWVVLVVKILKDEMASGSLAVSKRLTEIPSDLRNLFKDILGRDDKHLDRLRFSILWILYAKRPLQPKEFYHALWTALSLNDLADPEIPDLTRPDADSRVKILIISSSKGLAEVTKSKQPTVQFIHESVRDFLIKDKGLQELWPDLGVKWESQSHERLKQCCNTYMNHMAIKQFVTTLDSVAKSDIPIEISKTYPFLEYASQHVLYHADAAAHAIPQLEFLRQLVPPAWLHLINIFEKFERRRYRLGADLFYILADRGYARLIRTWTQSDQIVHFRSSLDRYRYPIFAALANGHKDAVAALLQSPSVICDGVDITEGLNFRKDLEDYETRTPLTWAAQKGREGIAKLLLEQGVGINEVDLKLRTALLRAIENGQEAMVRLLIDKGASLNETMRLVDSPLDTALRSGHEPIFRLLIDKGARIRPESTAAIGLFLKASRTGDEALVMFLIEKGADINAQDNVGNAPIHRASINGDEAIIKFLIEKGADINAQDKLGYTPIHIASINGHEAIVKLLIEKGADINTQDNLGYALIHRASINGHEAIIKLLIEKGADIHIRDKLGYTPILGASINGHEAIVKLLIEKGADINTQDNLGLTPILTASINGHKAIIRLLIEKGADINIRDQFGNTPILGAFINGHEAIVRLLIENGADTGALTQFDTLTLDSLGSSG